VFIAQAISTLILFVRRTLRGQAATVDEWAASIALGGLFFQLVGLGLSVMNSNWAFVDVNTELASDEPANHICHLCLLDIRSGYVFFGKPDNDRHLRYSVDLHYTYLASFTWSMLIQESIFEVVAAYLKQELAFPPPGLIFIYPLVPP
jgi:hypothetical protein